MHIDFHYNIFCLHPNFDYHFGWEKYNKKKQHLACYFCCCFLFLPSVRQLQKNIHKANKQGAQWGQGAW